MNPNYLEFEQPIAELEAKIRELHNVGTDNALNLDNEIQRLQEKCRERIKTIFSGLTDWQISQLARHPQRPYTLDYTSMIFDRFEELHGDRHFGDDHAIVGGLASLDGQGLMVIGHQKGRDTREKVLRNFGMPRPEGYRKALRLMEMAARYGRPVITFIDTPGAYPGLGAEERGQAEAIARNLREMADLGVPTVSVVTGEGGSGGALALGVTDRIFMLENAVYSVISPEGCAAILWRDATRAADAARAMRLTADDAQELGIIDGIIREPVGGAHRDHDGCAQAIKAQLMDVLAEIGDLPAMELRDRRLRKYLAMGDWAERR